MHKKMAATAICIAAFAMGASAQTTVTNGNNGVSGAVPVYSGAATLGPGSTSPITVSGGNVGIGTTFPSDPLSVNPAQYSTGSAYQSSSTITGVGTSWSSSLVGSLFTFSNGTSAGTITAVGSTTSLIVSTSQTAGSSGSPLAYTINYQGLNVTGTGYVGIGTTAPSYKLDVTGQIRSSSGGYIFPDGSAQTTAYAPTGDVNTTPIVVSTTGNLANQQMFGASISLSNTATSGSSSAQRYAIDANYSKSGTAADSGYAEGAGWFASNQTAGATSNLENVVSRFGITGGTVTLAEDFVADTSYVTGGTINSRLAFAVNDLGQTVGNQYAFYSGPLTSGAGNFGVFINGSQPNYFGGSVGIGTSSPSSLLSVGSSSQFQVGSTGAISTSGGLAVSGGTVSLPSASIANAALQGSGALTVTAGTGLSGGGAVALGGTTTLSLPNVGTAGTYGSATQVPVFTTDALGRITGVTNTAITGIPLAWSALTNPTANLSLSTGSYSSTYTAGAATGTNNLFNFKDTASNTGTGQLVNISTSTSSTLKPFSVYAAGGANPSLQVLANGNVGVGTSSPSSLLSVGSSSQFQVGSTGAISTSGGLAVSGGTVSLPSASIANAALQGSGALTVTAGTGLSGGGAVALGGTTTLSLPNVGTAGTYGSATQVPVFTTDALGRITSVTTTAISSNPGAATFTVPDTGGTAQWAKIGTFTGAQQGETVRLTAFIHQGYNAQNSQDSTYVISFKTSNDTSTDGNGFAGNGSYYAIGFNNSIPPGSIKWVANSAGTSATSFSLYISLPLFTLGSHYTVTVDPNASWAHSGTFTSDPGDVGSSTIMIPSAEFDLPYGNVGIGTTSPGAKLEVSGSLKLTAGSGGSITFQDGTTQSTAYTGVTCTGADYAEAVDVTGDRTKYEPGDLLVLNPGTAGKFLKSNEAYSTLVAGIYSTKPGIVGRLHPEDAATGKTEVPMAMVGRVPTKVSAENGPIRVGDLLVTSSTLGYAMKGTDRSRMLGAVVGKAMGNLDTGIGVIEVLVTLQ